MLGNQTILIIFLILLLVRAARAYNLGNNEAHQLPRRPCLPAFLCLALTMAMNVLRSKRPSLRGLLALPFSNFYFLVILNHCKIRLIITVIKSSTILSMAWQKNAIIAIIIRTVRMLWMKAILRTAITEVTIAAIWMITTLGTAIVVIVIRVIRPTGVQGDEDCQCLLVVN